jgi:hypothetical protein
VTLHGTVTGDSARENDGVSEGGACTFHSVWQGHDILQYATRKAVRVTLTRGQAVVRVSVPYVIRINGTREVTSLTGNCPNGAPALPPGGCTTYTGTMRLKLKITPSTVSVSGADGSFRPGLCPGDHGVFVPTSNGKRRAGRVTGSGELSGSSGGGTYEYSSRFQARVVRG